MGRNPRSGEPVSVEAKRKLHFKAGKDMRDRLHPEAALLQNSLQ